MLEHRSGNIEHHQPITIGAVYPFMVAHKSRKGKIFMGKRDNGSGTIRKVNGANGVKYYAYAPAVYQENADGDIICTREALGAFQKRTDARKALDDFLRHPVSKYNYTMLDVYNDWKAQAFSDITKSTQDNYTAAWAQILTASPDIAQRKFRDITTSQLRGILDFWMLPHEIPITKDGTTKLKKTKALSMSSLTKIKALCTQLYGYAMANNIIDKNYASLVRIPKGAEAGTKRAFTDAEFLTLENSWRNVPGGDAVYALCYLGFRVSEFLQLRPTDYDPIQHTLTGGLKTAAGRNRVVPVHENIIPIIDRWAAGGNEYLYTDGKGHGYKKDRFLRSVWAPAISALGLPSDLTPHCARHTCGTRLSAAGARPEDIQAILGHADYSVTANTYINQDVSTLTKSMALVK